MMRLEKKKPCLNIFEISEGDNGGEVGGAGGSPEERKHTADAGGMQDAEEGD